jgi:pyrroloquinoline quinone (PQQ) biosynthesis protein C
MDVVTESYLDFLSCGPEPGTGDDAKAFAAHHAACKGALAHLDALLKLARSMGAAPDEAEEAQVILLEAREALSHFPEEDPDASEEQC